METNNLTDEELGLEEPKKEFKDLGLETCEDVEPYKKKENTKKETVKKETPKKVEKEDKADAALKNAAANAALKAAIEANSEMSFKEAEKIYIIEKKKHMLNKCKEDDVVEFTPDKIYAQYFGEVYTFLYNTIPVTIRFDGTKQKFPRFIYNHIMKKIHKVSESNVSREKIEYR